MPIDTRLVAVSGYTPKDVALDHIDTHGAKSTLHRRVAFIGAVPRAGTTTAACAWAMAEMEAHPGIRRRGDATIGKRSRGDTGVGLSELLPEVEGGWTADER